MLYDPIKYYYMYVYNVMELHPEVATYIYSMAIPVYSTGNSGVFRARGGLKRLEYSLTTIKHKVHD